MNKSNILSREEIILLSRQLGIAINSGIPLTQSIEIIAEKTDNAALKEVLNKIHSDLTMSMQLSDAVKTHENYLTPFFVQMIVIGEESGTLVEVLNQIADSYEKQMESDNKLKTAVTYPILLSVLMLGVIVLLVVQVMPMFDGVLRSLGGELPPFTAAILSFSLFIKNNIIFIASAVLAIVIGLAVYGKTPSGRFKYDLLKFRLPVIKGINSAMLAARFARNLGMLVKSGMSIQQAFTLIKPTMNNLYAEEMLDERLDDIMKGDSLDEVLARMDLFPWLLNKLFSVAFMAGQIDKALMTAADEMEKDLDKKLGRLTNVIEPILIIILSVIVGIILISVVLPVINIMNAIG